MREALSFEETKVELRSLNRSFEAGRVTIEAWCDRVHDVFLRFDAGRPPIAVNLPALAATAAPRIADRAQTIAADLGNVVTQPNRGERHMMAHAG